MGDNTVCRRDHRDPIIWPKNLRLQTATVAHHCEVPPCSLAPDLLEIRLLKALLPILSISIGGCFGFPFPSWHSLRLVDLSLRVALKCAFGPFARGTSDPEVDPPGSQGMPRAVLEV